MTTRIEQHHVLFIRKMRQSARAFAQNKNLTKEHRDMCRREWILLAEIEMHLEEYIEMQRLLAYK